MTLKPTPSDYELRAMARAREETRRLVQLGRGMPDANSPIVPGPNAITSAIRKSDAEAYALVKRLNPDGESADRPKRRDDPEHREQVRLFVWIDTEQDDEIIKQAYAVPNGGKRGPLTAKKMKAEGVRAGELDINLDVPRGGWCGLRIELKAEGGYVTPIQRARINQHRANGFAAEPCFGWEAARDTLREYARLEKTTVLGVGGWPARIDYATGKPL